MISSEHPETVESDQEPSKPARSVTESARSIQAARIARANRGGPPGAGICFGLAPAFSKHGLARVLRAMFAWDAPPEGAWRQLPCCDASTYGFNSGKAALRFALEAMASLEPVRREVVVPAYTCFSVAAAVEQAGLSMVLCDVDPATLDYDPDMLRRIVSSKTLCIVAAHLFGSPIDLDISARLARENGAFVLEDAAQGGERAGDLSLCDVRLWSFARGKPISTFGGGMLACSNTRLDAVLRRWYLSVATAKRSASLKQIAGAIATDVGSHPRLYWLVRNLPFLRIGQTIYPEEIAIARETRFQRSLLTALGERIDGLEDHRRHVARYYYEAFCDAGQCRLPLCTKRQGYAPPRFPLYLGQSISTLASDDLARAGRFGVVPMYPCSLDRLPRIGDFCANVHKGFSGAREIADRVVTLPTHHWVGRRAQEQVVGAVQELQQQ